MIQLLDLKAQSYSSALEKAASLLDEQMVWTELGENRRDELFSMMVVESPDFRQNGVAVYHRQADLDGKPICLLIRLKGTGIRARPKSIRYVWLLISPNKTHPELAKALEFSRLMGTEEFAKEADTAADLSELLEIYERCLTTRLHLLTSSSEALRHTGKFLGGVRQDLKRRLPFYKSDFMDGFNSKVLARLLHFSNPTESQVIIELRRKT